jgi:predicted dehydrogenase
MKYQTIFIVGFGSIGKRHFQVITKVLPKVNIYLVHHSADSPFGGHERRTFGGHERITGEFPTYSDAFLALEHGTVPFPDLVFICNPSSFHLDVAWKFAKLQNPKWKSSFLKDPSFSQKTVKGIFIEKPISNSTKGVSEFLGYCMDKNIVVQVGYMLRFTHTLQSLKHILETNTLGDIYSVQTSFGEYLPGWRNSANYAKEVSAQKSMGGGVILEISHEFDYLSWLFGTPVSVKCIASKQSNLEIDVEDTADFLLQFPTNCTTENSLPRYLTANIHIDMLDIKPHRTLRVVCEYGTAIWSSGNTVTSAYTLDIYKRNESGKVSYEQIVEPTDITSSSTTGSSGSHNTVGNNDKTTSVNRNYIMYKQLTYFLSGITNKNAPFTENDGIIYQHNNGMDALLIVENAKKCQKM